MTWSPIRRRGALAAGAVLVIVLLLLLAIRLGSGDGGDDGGVPPRPQTSTSATSPSTASTQGVRLPNVARTIEGDVSGARVRLEVQPLVRAPQATVLTALFTVTASQTERSFTFSDTFAARGEQRTPRASLSDVRLFAPEMGLLANPATSAKGDVAATSVNGAPSLARGESAGLRVVFPALPPGVQRADVLWPLLGVVADLPIVAGPVPDLPAFGDQAARDVDLAGVTGEALPVTARSSELAGAIRTEQAPAQTRVVLAADVLFALDRADLSPQASTALDRAAAAIQAAGPGPVKVTGHTDDQGTDQYNLDLSKRRAQSVATALAPRLPPDRFPVEVAGRGEAEPAVKGTTPEARAANRRVELLVERRQQTAPAAAPTAPVTGGGPTAKGSAGLLFDQDGGSQMRIRAEQAVRQGGWLRVDLTLTVERSEPDGTTDLLVDLRDTTRRTLRADASGIGVLSGSVLHLPAVDPKGICACANTLFGLSIVGLEQRKMSLWVGAPANVGSSVTVQLPDERGRLLDVPVAR